MYSTFSLRKRCYKCNGKHNGFQGKNEKKKKNALKNKALSHLCLRR